MAVNKSSKKNKRKNRHKKRTNKKKLGLEKKIITKNENKKVLIENEIVDDNEILNNNVDISKRNYCGLILIFLIILVLGLIVMFFPRIVLSGSEEVTINYNDSYVEPGYKGYVFNKDISEKINVVSDIKDGVLGNYEVNYYIDLFGARVKKTRNVMIIDNISPVITAGKDVIKICPNEEIPALEYEAIDEYDGNLTQKVEEIIREDEILLKVDDFSDNSALITIKIDRSDDEKPVIKLKGNSTMFLTYGNTFKEPGYTAMDNCSGDITDRVIVSGNVSRKIGTYELKYEVSDDNGNKEVVTRRVIIGSRIKDNGSINKGTIYLTFDDGPNQGTTNKILDILKSEGVKATFFVTCNGPDNLIKRMYDEGHTVALHTASHDYSYVYSSVDNYFKDLNKVSARVKRITGIDSKIIRFPGGSSNMISRNYNRGIMTELTNIVLSEGYRYFDWNVDGMDASSARNSDDVYYNVTSNLSSNRANVVLMHDTKNITVGALKDIIKFGKEYGYKFSAIDMNTYMVRHSVNN